MRPGAMNRPSPSLAFLPLAFALAIAAAVLGSSARPASPPLNLLLVSVDTLRADAVGAYCGRIAATPWVDGLAAGGFLLERAFAPASLTLPSHASILTGRTPAGHGLHDNLGYRLGPGGLTLAEHLKAQGFKTAAFVGAFPLDARFGLAQGFDLYDDQYGETDPAGGFFFTERSGDQVAGRAAAWIRRNTSQAWFAFVHFFDPHQPYAPTEPYASRYSRNPYAGEVAFADASFGRLLDALRETGLESRTVVLLTADHGESLGEHGELTHGYFAYNSTLHVPLVVRAPGRPGGRRSSTPVGLVDIFPTVCDLLGVSPPPSLDGRSLRPLWEGRSLGDRPIYFESLAPNLNRNWAPLRGVVSGGRKFIDLPLAELYDLAADFAEERNLAPASDLSSYRKDLAAHLSSAGDSRAGRRPEPKANAKALESLGYLGGGPGTKRGPYGPSDDLKTLLPLHQKLMSAAEAFVQGRPDESVALLEGVLGERKDLVTAYEYLANVYYQTGRRAEAIAALERGLAAVPGQAQMEGRLGIFLVEAGRLDRGRTLLESALATNGEDAELWNYLGVCDWKRGAFAAAEKSYLKALDLDPGSASALNNLGSLSLSRKEPDAALAFFDRALAFDPNLAETHNGRAVALSLKGDLQAAVGAWKKAVDLDPRHAQALFNLATSLLKKDRLEEAAGYFERYLKAAPADDPDREKVAALLEALKKSLKK